MGKINSSTGDYTKVQLYADVDSIEGFATFHKQLGMNQREAASRLFTWFNQQSPLIRQHILQPMPEEVAPDIARIILERMAERDRLRNNEPPPTTEQNTATSKHKTTTDTKSLTVYGPHSPNPTEQS